MCPLPIPPLKTKAEFKQDTRGGTFDRRNTIRFIDDALDEWHKTKSLDGIVRVYKECRHWLKAKQLKSGGGNTPNRKVQIQNLLNSTLPWMGELDPGFRRAFDKFETKKAHLGPHTGLQPMQGVYMHERSLYVKNNKQRAISASLLDIEYPPGPSAKKPGNFPKKFEDLSEQQYAECDRLTTRATDVIYLRKMSRLRHMLLINATGKFTGIDGQLTNTDPKFGWPFAMDKYGNIFTLNDRTADGQFNHSSFNAGNDVVCAGFIKIVNGELLLVSNNSGHYKPERKHLKNLLGILKTDQVDLNKCKIEFHDYSTGKLCVYESSPSVFEVSRDGIQLARQRGVEKVAG